jgi:hypothetical protein
MDEEYLESMKQNLLSNKENNGIETADFTNSNGILVLKTIVDCGKVMKTEEFNGVKQQNLFITKTNKKARYVLHFSMIMNDNNQPEYEQYLKHLTKSFKVDFMLE